MSKRQTVKFDLRLSDSDRRKSTLDGLTVAAAQMITVTTMCEMQLVFFERGLSKNTSCISHGVVELSAGFPSCLIQGGRKLTLSLKFAILFDFLHEVFIVHPEQGLNFG